MAPTRNHCSPSRWFYFGMTDNQRVPRRSNVSNDCREWNYSDAYADGYASKTTLTSTFEIYGEKFSRP